MQILILGMHRSGTSMLTRLVNIMGAYFGPDSMATRPNDENPKGFWERRDIRKLNDDLLFSVGADWHRVADYDPNAIPLGVRHRFQEEARSVIARMDEHGPWVMKEPRLCVNLPAWLPLLSRPVCLICERDPIEIACSLQTRNQIDLPAGIALAQAYYRRTLRETADIPRAIVHHRDLIADPLASVRRIRALFDSWGITSMRMPDGAEVLDFIDPTLYRQRGEGHCPRDYLTESQSVFFSALKASDWRALTEMVEAPQTELHLLRMFEDSQASKAALRDLIRPLDLRIEELSAQNRILRADLNRKIAAHSDALHLKRSSEAKKLDSLIRSAQRDVRSLEGSLSWRLGYSVVATAARMIGKRSGTSIFETLQQRLELVRTSTIWTDTGLNHSSSKNAETHTH